MSEHAISNARAWLESIREMVAALDGEPSPEAYRAAMKSQDFDAPGLTVEQRPDGWHWTAPVEHDPGNFDNGDGPFDSEAEAFGDAFDSLGIERPDGADEDEAREEIQESPLSLQVRGGWYSPGDEDRGGAPEEFEILLTTGGPALRIIGELDCHGQPESPRLQWQDWGTPWTDFTDTSSDDDEAVQTFCQQFYFGEGC